MRRNIPLRILQTVTRPRHFAALLVDAPSWMFFLLLGLAGASGCGGEGAGPYPLQGKVVFEDGQPAKELAGYGVMFESVEEINGRKVSGSGIVDAEGNFTIGTKKAADGAMVGRHNVAITPPIPQGDAPAPKPIIEARYSRFETSKLQVVIEAKTNIAELTVQRISPTPKTKR